jgi:hypothetical protein
MRPPNPYCQEYKSPFSGVTVARYDGSLGLITWWPGAGGEVDDGWV